MVVAGMGTGGELSLGALVLAEFSPPSSMNALTMLAAWWGLGGVLSGIISLMVNLIGFTFIDEWRLIVVLCAVLETYLATLRFFMKETPQYLYLKGRYEELYTILYEIATVNNVECMKIELNSSY